MTDKIVVGVDFGAEGDDALVEALRLARKLDDVELHPVHVLPTPDAVGRKEHLDVLSHMLSAAAEELRHRTLNVAEAMEGDLWEQHVTVHVRFGKPADVLQQVAIDVDADLIVVGTHARRGMQRLILGSVAEEVLRLGRFPVLVARPKRTAGMSATESIEPPRSGEDLHAQRKFSRSERLTFGRRESHIAGMI